MQSGNLRSWIAQMDDVRARWTTLLDTASDPAKLGQWHAAMEAMTKQMLALKRQGTWARGPFDLLSIVGLQRWELAHSAALAWLCDPVAAHGLGDSLLRSLLDTTAGPRLSTDGIVETACEVSRAESRADVVVTGATWTLVIEVKVDAVEGQDQAQRLHRDWVADDDVRLIFLTRRGIPPRSATAEVANTWTPLSWRTVRTMTREAASAGSPTAQGRAALLQYLHTLETTF